MRISFSLMLVLLGVLVSFAAGGGEALAEESDADSASAAPVPFINWETALSFVSVRPALLGGAIEAAGLLKPVADKAVFFGPRVGLMEAAGSGNSRTDFGLGLEAELWVVNQIGPGIGADWVESFSDSDGFAPSSRFRIEPFLGLRFMHFQGKGAWALRLALPYDSYYLWGLSAGISLQWSGVPEIGD